LQASKTIVIVAAALALAAGLYVAQRMRAPAALPLQAGIALPQPRPIAPFALTDQDGRPFGNAQLAGHWTLLFAGFTHCPDVCPTTLAVLKQVEQRLPAPGVQTVFLSVDPERDTPPVLEQYVRHFSPAMRGVSGAPDQLEALCASLGIAYVKVPGARAGEYSVDHSAALVLIDPEGRVAGYFQAPHRVDTLAADLSAVLASRS
jgi:protein SCO1/2